LIKVKGHKKNKKSEIWGSSYFLLLTSASIISAL
jgi:hypothetical protein